MYYSSEAFLSFEPRISRLMGLPWWLRSPVAQMVKNQPAVQETQVRSLGQEDPLDKGMAFHSSVLAWRIPRREEPGGLQSMGSQRVGRDRVTNTATLQLVIRGICLQCGKPRLIPGLERSHGEGNGYSLQYHVLFMHYVLFMCVSLVPGHILEI